MRHVTFLLAGLLGCGILDSFAPAWAPLAPTAQIAPRLGWREEWSETWRMCGSLVRETSAYSYDDLLFFRVDADAWTDAGGRQGVVGLWRNSQIYLARWAVELSWPNRALRHEMLHAMIAMPGHPPVFSFCHL